MKSTPTRSDKIARLFRAFAVSSRPPSNLEMWRWWEQNIVLDNTSSAQGRYSTEIVPVVRIWAKYAQDPRVRRFVAMMAAQSTKTQNLINMAMWESKEDPAPCMWVMASKDNVEEFIRKRFIPAMESCGALRDILPKDRTKRSKMLFQMATMNFIFRGSNSRIGLQSDPIRRIKCDERREWKPGAIDLLRKRLRTFSNSLEISTGTAGVVNDELHLDWQDGSQGFIHWQCPHCQQSQPFRFGRKSSPLWPDERTKGGLVWDEEAKIDGEWDEKKVRASVRYECEKCGHLFKNHEKLFLLQSIHEWHRREDRLPAFPSLHWNALYMPWPSCDWEEVVWEYLKAIEALKKGNVQPLKAFQTETLGEPWLDNAQSADVSDLHARKGAYKVGEKWPAEPGIVYDIITLDFQQGFIMGVHRQWKRPGASRLIRPLRFINADEAHKYACDQGIRPKAVFIDMSWQGEKKFDRKVAEACVKYGWNPIAGWAPSGANSKEELSRKEFDQQRKEWVTVKGSWTSDDYDPNLNVPHDKRIPGVNGENVTLRRFQWVKNYYRTQLFIYTIKGDGLPWEIPCDIEEYQKNEPKEYRYMGQMRNLKRIPLMNDNNEIASYEWVEEGRHDFPDCELMQEAAADICDLKRAKI